ncbi:CcdC protein domain-containing protein [Sphingomonas nostoxanthinifaciens]|uniref:CcdC protein domain-containing protein n=1 Tax=Sphingomonas nostoxanthinifaciens TaxID=2872652 RepID=UPI001CC21D10|nr:CcdC protein domain-containing protein [Sphingomonas nostoxanthinifaciens]
MPAWISYLITAAVIGIVLMLRVRGMRRARRLRLEQLWIVPAIYGVLTLWILYQFPPHGAKWLWLAVALALGAALGWRRAAYMRITIDPATHALNQQASPAALVFIVVLILLRQGLRYEAPALGLDIMTVTDVLVVFALGLLAATRAEMFLRARRMLAMAGAV